MRGTARTGACFTALLVAAVGGCGRSGLGELENGPSTPSTSGSSSGSSSGGEPGPDSGAGSSSGGSSGSSGSVGLADSGPGEMDAPQPAPDCGSAAGLVTLASGQSRSAGLAVDSANIYWLLNSSANRGTVTVMKESLCGGPVSTLATVPGNQGSSLVTDGHDVYWAEQGWVMGDIQVTPNALFSVPAEGGTVSTIWSSQDRDLHALAVDPTGVYAIDWPGYGAGSLVRLPLAGGPTTTLASGFYEPEDLTIAGTMVYWVDGHAGGMYPTPGAVMAVPIGGGTPVTFAQGGTDPAEVVATSSNLVWTSGGTDLTGQLSALVTAPLAGGATTTLAGPSNMPFAAIAADDANVYFAYAIPGPTGLMKVDLTGASPPTTLLSSANASAVTVDSTSVYWTDWYAGTIMKLTPK